MAFALDSLDLHISRNVVTNFCWFMSKILTVTGFIFSSPWSLLLSGAMLKQLVFIWLTSASWNSGAIARLRVHETLVFSQAYACAIFDSGKMFPNNGPKWSAIANGKLCSSSLSRSEPTATKCCVIGLWDLLLFNKSTCFLEVQCLSKSTFLWCSTGMDLSQIKQNKLYKVICGCVFLRILAYFLLQTTFPEPCTSPLFPVSSQE